MYSGPRPSCPVRARSRPWASDADVELIIGEALLSPGPAPVAQRIERLTTDQKVGSSNLFGRARVRMAAGTPSDRIGIRRDSRV